MKVFKFGGASIKTAKAVKNMSEIVKSYAPDKLIVVVSAMGKSTNNLEHILHQRRNGLEYEELLLGLYSYHVNLCKELFHDYNTIEKKINLYFSQLKTALESESSYDEHYDQVVSYGELLSSLIISEYLQSLNTSLTLIDSRQYIITNDTFRNAEVNWDITQGNISELMAIVSTEILITQGFLGGTINGQTTTLGREGSDFTAAIFASCLNAESVTVWKDVPGILNADPKLLSEATLFSELPYKEAAEMTYYGASVIHPKTIKPLANRNIPLFVKSFDNPNNEGTIIHNCDFKKVTPAIIIKNNQCLVSFHVIDYTFIDEGNLSLIFRELAALDIKINIMQNSAISFSIVIDYDENKVATMLSVLSSHFDIKYNTDLTLITIKNYQKKDIEFHRKGKNILLEQMSRNNYRALYSD